MVRNLGLEERPVTWLCYWKLSPWVPRLASLSLSGIGRDDSSTYL